MCIRDRGRRRGRGGRRGVLRGPRGRSAVQRRGVDGNEGCKGWVRSSQARRGAGQPAVVLQGAVEEVGELETADIKIRATEVTGIEVFRNAGTSKNSLTSGQTVFRRILDQSKRALKSISTSVSS